MGLSAFVYFLFRDVGIQKINNSNKVTSGATMSRHQIILFLELGSLYEKVTCSSITPYDSSLKIKKKHHF